ncbi:MAG: PQQ-binding-like beta-propeller repeat protein [Planctomycetales bacterium]
MTDGTQPPRSPSSPPAGTAAPSASARRFRWQWGLAIATVGALLMGTAWWWFDRTGDRTRQVMWMYYLGPASAFIFLLWWTFADGLSRAARLAGLAVVAACVGGFFAIYRFDGFAGDMSPRFVRRSEPRAEEQARAYFKEAAKKRSASTNGERAAEPVQLEITDDDWPEYRGPNRDGIVRNVAIRSDWSAQPPIELWQHPVGQGWSSFAVVDDFVWTQEQRQDEECVVCYELMSGKEVWLHANDARFAASMGGVGPRATPTVHDSRVYALGATGILDCLDATTGKLLWTTNVLDDAGAENLDWGMAGSPLVYDDLVVVAPGGGEGKSVAAYDRITGEKRWSAGDHPTSYSAPRLETIDGVRQVLVFDGTGLAGYDPANGRPLWRSNEWRNQPMVNAVQPIVRDERYIFMSSSYGLGSQLLDVRRRDGQWPAEPIQPVWRNDGRFRLKFNEGAYHDGHVYGLDETVLACIDFMTGEQKWKRGRYGYGQLLLVEDKLLILAEDGTVSLVAARPDKYEELARFQAISAGCWNVPALVRGLLLVRNDKEAACFDLRPESAAPTRLSNDE